MTILNRLASNWNWKERERLNTNWAIIENYLSNLQGQINLLTGDVNVQELIDELNRLLNDGTIILGELESALNNVTEIITDAQSATENANDATQSALNAINDIQSMIDNFQSKGTYDNDTVYSKNNSVFYEGSSYIYTNNTPSKGNPPPNYPTVANDHWQMTAAKGASGDGAVSKVNGKEPDGAGEVILTASDVGAASTEQLEQMKPKVDNSWQKGVYNETDIMNIGPIYAKRMFIIEGGAWKAPDNHLEQLNITLPCSVFSGLIKVNYTSTYNTVNAMGGMEVSYSFSKVDNTPYVSTREILSSSSKFASNFYVRAVGLTSNSIVIPLVRAPYVTQQAIFVTVEIFGHAYIDGVSKNLHDVLKGATTVFEDLGPTVAFYPWTPQASQIPTYDAIGRWDSVAHRFKPACEIVADWNNVTENGMYMALNATNAPRTDAWFMGTVIVHQPNWIVQKLILFTGDQEFERTNRGGTWDEWIETSPRKLFQSVSNGKAAVNQAVTDMGVYTAPDAPFATTAANIRAIQTQISVKGEIPLSPIPSNGLLEVYTPWFDFQPMYFSSTLPGMSLYNGFATPQISTATNAFYILSMDTYNQAVNGVLQWRLKLLIKNAYSFTSTQNKMEYFISK